MNASCHAAVLYCNVQVKCNGTGAEIQSYSALTPLMSVEGPLTLVTLAEFTRTNPMRFFILGLRAEELLAYVFN